MVGFAAPPAFLLKNKTLKYTDKMTMAAPSTDQSYFDEVRPTRETYIARLNEKFIDSLTKLGAYNEQKKADLSPKIKSMSTFVYESMSNLARNYHFVEHVFQIIEGNVFSKNGEPVLDSIAVLAALFHDCVYSNVDDGGLSSVQREKLDGAILEEESPEDSESVTVRMHPDSMNDPLLRVVMSIFGFQAGQILTPSKGQNEFMSAVIAARELESLLSLEILAKIAACIEATIPFRSDNDQGESALEQLYKRLVKTVSSFSLDMSEKECIQAVQRAALVANEDVGNFGTTDPAYFIDNTWSLLPESNVALRYQDIYTVNQFHHAMYKMKGFFSFITPEVIYQQFHGVPDDDNVKQMTANAARNIQIGARYVAAKLVSSAFLAAMANLTGGDTPISEFMGNLPRATVKRQRMEDKLNILPTPQDSSVDTVVYDLLVKGRHKETCFDLKESPLAAHFYARIGDKGLDRVLGDVKSYPMTKNSAERLLSSLPQEAVLEAGEKIAELGHSRSKRVSDVLRNMAR